MPSGTTSLLGETWADSFSCWKRDLSFVRVDDPQPVVVHLHLPVQFDLFPVIQHEIGTLCQQTGLRVCSRVVRQK